MKEKKLKRDPKVNEEFDNQKEKQEPLEQEAVEACSCSNRETNSCNCSEQVEEIDEQCSCNCSENSDKDDLLEKLTEAEAKQEEYLKMAQRVQADFENYKRRNRNTVAETYQTAAAEVVEAFLPVLDNLDRAVESIPVTEVDESVLKGIELVRRQFLDTLAKLDVKEIDALGKPFDPEYHNAVGQVDAEEENTVVMVHQKGYKMAERVLRYSMVHVAR